MFPRSFDYVKVETVGAACEMKSRHGERCAFLAGGTDLLVQMRNGKRRVEYVVDLKGIKGLDEVTVRGDGGYRIGALTPVSALCAKAGLVRDIPALATAVAAMASLQVRNRATVGGNLCNASPCADLVPALLLVDAEVELLSPGGTRTMPLDQFFVSPGQTALRSDELLAAVLVPSPGEPMGQSYQKFMRTSMDLALVGVACGLRIDAQGRCRFARVALGSVGPVPLRARQVEAFLLGKALSEEVARAAAALAVKECAPISDVRASKEYREELVAVLTARALRAASVSLID